MARASAKETKPQTNRFTLWQPAASGQWAKKIRRRVNYFGTDQQAALDRKRICQIGPTVAGAGVQLGFAKPLCQFIQVIPSTPTVSPQ